MINYCIARLRKEQYFAMAISKPLLLYAPRILSRSKWRQPYPGNESAGVAVGKTLADVTQRLRVATALDSGEKEKLISFRKIITFWNVPKVPIRSSTNRRQIVEWVFISIVKSFWCRFVCKRVANDSFFFFLLIAFGSICNGKHQNITSTSDWWYEIKLPQTTQRNVRDWSRDRVREKNNNRVHVSKMIITDNRFFHFLTYIYIYSVFQLLLFFPVIFYFLHFSFIKSQHN